MNIVIASATQRWTTALIVVGLLLSASMSSFAEDQGNPNQRVLPPESRPHGKSYAEWAAQFWQWNSALPIGQNPNLDGENCENGANGQSGPVWFLGQSTGGFVVRHCTVPLGHNIFFSVLAGNCSTLEAPPFFGNNEAELRACIHAIIDLATIVSCEVDGVPIQEINSYRMQSPVFEINFPPDNIAGVPGGGTGLAVVEGWFIMLAPLSKGSHTIHVHAEIPDFGFVQDITYHLMAE